LASDDRTGTELGGESSSRAPAVARVAAILSLLSKERTGLGVSEIARKLGIVPSTCFHVLRALVDEGFVSFDADRKTYRTSVGLLSLVRDSLASGGYVQAVQPHLDRLAATYNLTAVAVELDNFERMVVVGIGRAASMVSLHVNVGSRFPQLISATGRCVAARSGLTKAELADAFSRLRWEQTPDFEMWYRDVLQTGETGVAIDQGNFARGITVIATLVPVLSDASTRGLALIGLEHQMTVEVLQVLRREILSAAADVGEKLG